MTAHTIPIRCQISTSVCQSEILKHRSVLPGDLNPKAKCLDSFGAFRFNRTGAGLNPALCTYLQILYSLTLDMQDIVGSKVSSTMRASRAPPLSETTLSLPRRDLDLRSMSLTTAWVFRVPGQCWWGSKLSTTERA